MRPLLPLTIALLLTSCNVGPEYFAPILPTDAGWQTTQAVDAAQAPQVAWWEGFNDPTLTELVTEAAQHNHDVRIAMANVDEARALRRVSASTYYPSIGADANAEREGFSTRTGNNNNGSERERDSFDAGLDASWEIDLFGKTGRAVEAADARIAASEANYQDVMLSVLAEVARNYYELRGTQKRIDVTRRNVELLVETEKLAQSLFENGATSEFDVALARGEREAFEATLPNLEAEMMAGIYRLSVLTGKPPEHHLERLKASAPLPMPPDMVPVGLRGDLLKRRPDVKRAERELAAANAEIGVATAQLFPSLTLTGGIGSSARAFSDLFASGGFTYLIGQAIALPIFQGGRLQANIDAADARTKAAVANYEKTVLTALEDAESSLVRYGKEWQTLNALKAAEATRKDAHNLARLRYESGNESFLIMLEAERALVTLQDSLIQSETRALTKLTQLYKALGGGWEKFVEPQ